MEVNQILYMNGGDAETSYAKNSLIAKEVMCKAKPILEESIVHLYLSSIPKCVKLADFGCSSGPNTLFLVREIMDIIHATCSQQGVNHRAPMFQVFLNDLTGNDFNTIFRSLPSFYEKLKKEKGSEFGPCFIAGMPGTFYGRLFPDCFLDFVHSCNSLHWRSQVPEGLVGESGIPLNKGNINITKKSPSIVHTAYSDLFEKDFASFLRSRSQEMVPGGHMVLTLLTSSGRADSSGNQGCFMIWELLGITLNDMVQEGKVEEAKLDRFNVPFYAPTLEQARDVIQTEGTFKIHRFETFEMDWDCNRSQDDKSNKGFSFEKPARGKYVAMSIRVATESMLVYHFGEEMMDDLFERFSNKIDEYLEVEEAKYTHMIISLIKND